MRRGDEPGQVGMDMDGMSAVVFSNRRGLRLFGILHLPPGGARRDTGVILLSPGVKMRVGPEGLYRRLADLFVSLGFPVLRFDYYGLGDSEGDLTEEYLKDVYSHIEIGRFVDDTIDAMNWMQDRCGTTRFLLSGLCGGAMTGLLAASRDDRIAGLHALGLTCVVSSRAADPSRYFSLGELEHLRKGYVKKLLDPSSWLRLLSFQSDYRVIVRSVMAPLRKRAQRTPAAGPPPVAGASEDARGEADNRNPLFPPAFLKVLGSKRPMLLIYGGSDRLRWDFEEKFVQRYRAQLEPLASGYEVRVVEHANHVFTFRSWQNEVLQLSNDWLRRHFRSG